MSELQLGLLIIGALAVVGVFVFNRHQERRARRRAEQAFQSRHADVLLESGEARREPAAGSAPHRRTDDSMAPAQEELPDERLDYLIELRAESPVAAVVLLEPWPALERRFGRRVLLAACADDGRWRRVAAGATGAYRRWRAALQLVSRAGVIGEGELVEFRSALETLAAHAGLGVTAPEMRTTLEAARALDAICADADIQVALHIVGEEGREFDVEAARQALQASGMTSAESANEAHWVQRDSDDLELYALTVDHGSSEQRVLRLTLTMDVPRTPELRRSYEAMVLMARDLAKALSGVVQDDNRRVLDEHALSAIGQQLDAVRLDLERRGFAPGSRLALRLFS